MAKKFWTLLTGGIEVDVFFDHRLCVEAAAEAVRGYGDDGDEITVDNYLEYLKRYNDEMEQMGEAGYLAQINEHELPTSKLVISVDGNTNATIYSDSALLVDAEVAVINSDFADADYDASDIMEVQVGQYTERFVGHETAVQAADATILGGDIDGIFQAIADKNTIGTPKL